MSHEVSTPSNHLRTVNDKQSHEASPKPAFPTPALPSEILLQIFQYLSILENAQSSLYASSLVSTSWHKASISFLYERPHITGRNYDAFVRAICPSVNAHVRHNGLATFVKWLDMSLLVHNGSKSLTARVLGRVKGQLEGFVAPQASFAINCLAAISKCHKLRVLDLSYVSEAITMADLLRSTTNLMNLKTFHFPRSSAQEGKDPEKTALKHDWPPNLQDLHLSGGIRNLTVLLAMTIPSSVSHLTIKNAPHLTWNPIETLLRSRGPQLRSLEILAPIPNICRSSTPMNNVMRFIPNINLLKVSIDFISIDFFFAPDEDLRSLHRLYLDCFETPAFPEGYLAHLSNAVFDGRFEALRIIGLHRRLGWRSHDPWGVEELDLYLKAKAREDGPEAEISEEMAGVVFFGKK